jgi:hypothetical protein
VNRKGSDNHDLKRSAPKRSSLRVPGRCVRFDRVLEDQLSWYIKLVPFSFSVCSKYHMLLKEICETPSYVVSNIHLLGDKVAIPKVSF